MKQFLLLLCCAGAISAAAQLPQGIFVQNLPPKTLNITNYTEVTMPIQAVSVVVKVSPQDTLAPVSPYLFGTNANQYSGNLNNEPKLIEHLQKLKPGIIRYPGGLHSDEFFWNVEWDWNLRTPEGKTGGWFKNLPNDLPPFVIKSGQTESTRPANYSYWVPGKGYWTFGLDDYYDLLKKTGAEGLITVNYGYARYGTGPNPVQSAAHLAAEWVRYDKGRTKFWEIGNENVAPWSSSYKIIKNQNKDGQAEILTPVLYGQHCRVFIDSMRKAATELGVKIYIGIQNDLGVLEGASDSPDWMVDHTYYTNFQENSGTETILNSPFAETKKYADKVLSESARWKTKPKPITMTEWNIFAEGSKQAASYINGMHLVLVLGEMIKNHYALATRWDIANGWGAKGDDMGMFSTGDDPDGPNAKWNPRAPFYYQYFFQKIFGNHLVTSTTSGRTGVYSYASVLDDGKIGLVLVNTLRTDEVAQLEVPNWPGIQRFYQYSLTGGSDNGDFSLQVSVNGIGPSTTKIGGPIHTFENIKAQTAVVNDLLKIRLPRLSVQYLLLEKKQLSTSTLDLEKENSFRVYPNPFQQKIYLDLGKLKARGYEICHLSGQTVQMGKFDAQQQVELQATLPRGIYLLKVFHESGLSVQKVLAQ